MHGFSFAAVAGVSVFHYGSAVSAGAFSACAIQYTYVQSTGTLVQDLDSDGPQLHFRYGVYFWDVYIG